MAGPIYTSSSTGTGSGGGSAPTSTWANRPSVGTVGSRIYISDVGEYGAEFVSNGTVWAHTGEIEIIQKAKGWIVPSLAAANAATYSQSGTTITVTSTGHNIPATAYNSKDVYLNVGTAATGATIPPGWFSNFQRTGADTFTCVSTVSQTGTGTVNTNIAEITVGDLTSSVPGGLLGLNGKLMFSLLSSNNNSAGAKTARFNFNGTPLDYINTTATISNLATDPVPIMNRNNQASQVLGYNGVSTILAVDTSVDITCNFSLTCAAASDYIAIHAASVYIIIS